MCPLSPPDVASSLHPHTITVCWASLGVSIYGGWGNAWGCLRCSDNFFHYYRNSVTSFTLTTLSFNFLIDFAVKPTNYHASFSLSLSSLATGFFQLASGHLTTK